MAGEPTPVTPPAPPAEPDPAAVVTPSEPVTTPPAEPEPEQWDEARARATITRQREAEKQLKAKLKEAEAKAAKLDELEAANQSDLEKAQARVEALEAQATAAHEKLESANLIAALSTVQVPDPKDTTKNTGVRDPRASAKLITGVEYDDEGEPTNLTERVVALLTEYDFLSAAQGSAQRIPPPATNAGTGQHQAGGPVLTPEELQAAKDAGMTPERYAALKDVSNISEFEQLQRVEAAAQT